MHDPMTMAFEIKSPFYKYKPWPKKARRDPNPFAKRQAWKEMSDKDKATRDQFWMDGYRESLFTIWHVDPEIGGGDDSCGYSYVRLTKKQVEVLRNVAWSEGHTPHFLRDANKKWTGTCAESESLSRGLYFLVCRVLNLKATYAQASEYASKATHIVDCCGFGGEWCFLPGYHTNSNKDTPEHRQDHFHSILCGVARNILTERRPWWKHPRYHFWHWKIQFHFGQLLYRWLFARCCMCGKRFKQWGESPISDWNGTRIWHQSCDSINHKDPSPPMS